MYVCVVSAYNLSQWPSNNLIPHNILPRDIQPHLKSVEKHKTHMGITITVGNLMQIKQGLVHMLLQIQSSLARFQSTSPFILFWLLQKVIRHMKHIHH